MTTSTRQLSYYAKDGQWVGELSEVNLVRVYPDACDLGVRLVSHVTGLEAVYVIDNESRDAEGELRYYELKPTLETLRRLPALRGTFMTLYND